MSFEILNKLFPDDIPDVSLFFAHDPQHGFTASVVFEITGLSHYRTAYNKFVEEHWLPTRLTLPETEDLSVTIGPVTVKVEEAQEETTGEETVTEVTVTEAPEIVVPKATPKSPVASKIPVVAPKK